MVVLDALGVAFAPEPARWSCQLRKPLGELLAPGCVVERTFVEILHALQLARRQRLELCLQLLDALAQLPQPCRSCRGRRDWLCERSAPLLWRLSREHPGTGKLRVVGTTSRRQLL